MEKFNSILDNPRLDNLTNEIWKSAERLRGKFKQYEYRKVVLPMIVLRRLECVLVDWREQKKADIRAKRPAIKDAGTGGMLSVAKEHLRNKAKSDAERSAVEKFVTVHGQELDLSNFAICLSDLLIKNDPQAKITFGNSLVPFEQEKGDENDDLGDRWQEPKWKFDYMLSNPPFGVTWGYEDPKVKIFPTSAFVYHKVEVVFWQTDAEDRPLWKKEPYERKFTATELKKDQMFYAPETLIYTVKFADGTEDEFWVSPKTDITKELKKFLHEHAEVQSVVVEHPEYVEDSEYIPFEKDIETFLNREITTPLIRWAELPQLGYEILPNKYFYKYVPPVSTKELMKNFRLLEREADELLKGLDA